MEKQFRNVLVLFCCQSTLQVTGVTMIAVTGLAGYAFADNKAFATAPLTCYVFGSAITTIPASLLMRKIGRRGGFQTGTSIGILGGLVCGLAVWLQNFWVLCAGMMVMGMYTAFGKYYRFAAADSASAEFRAKAISLTLAGGVLGGIIGPELAKRTRTLFESHQYLGSYLSLAVVCAIATLILTRLDIPKLSEDEQKHSGRPLAEIMRQPVFIVAALSSMLAYGIMNLMMTSTPLAMRAHDHHFDDSAFVLGGHMIGMYAPSFFTGHLITRIGALRVMLIGIALLFLCVVAAVSGTAVINFWLAMFVLGVGWNFMYVSGSALLTEVHTPAERAKTQAANDFMIFLTMAVSSMSSGFLLTRSGWTAVNYGTIPFLVLALSATVWLMWKRRAAGRHG